MTLDDPSTSASGGPDDGALLVVGLGASAGGLEALSALLRGAELDEACFVVMQHLSPTQRSTLAELLGRQTLLSVAVAEDGATLASHHVYVAPPNAELALENGKLRVVMQTPDSRARLPIDDFFRSLAADRGARAVGVVLSGTGTDGTLGLGAIKAAGGVTFVQDPSSAKFDGMPRSAIESGHADFVFPPERIAEEIANVAKAGPRDDTAAANEEALARIGELVKSAFGLDLAHYKRSTIDRRIQRRMALCRAYHIADYVRLCQTDPRELAELHRDLLINVTGFFRDREPFEILQKEILPRILADKKRGDALRIWVAGCASGEEAYSIAICLLEHLEQHDAGLHVQIFATDVDSEAVQQARRGLYPDSIASDVPPDLLRKYFRRTEGEGYQVMRQVRDLVIFSVQNIARDAPFSRVDLVSCRNLLIYLQPNAQRRVLRILHYALAPRGYLLLGSSESVGDALDLFSLVDRKNKIYAAKHMPIGHSTIELAAGASSSSTPRETVRTGSTRPALNIAQVADRKILELYAPPGVVLNENLDVLHYRGRTSAYLEQPSGQATHDLLRLIRPELHLAVKDLVERAFATHEPIEVQTKAREGEGSFRPLTLVAQPLYDPETKARCLLILFKEDQGEPFRTAAADAVASTSMSDQARVLAEELALTKDYLRGTIEELECANEDLQSANEELQSANEELQSTNEELETSKEELQSTNEELITLNEELQSRMRDLGTTSDDLQNLLVGVDSAVLLVGLDLRVRCFSHAAELLLRLSTADVGRPIAQLGVFASTHELAPLIAGSVERCVTAEAQIDASESRRLRVRAVPYKTFERNVRGAVVTFAEVARDGERT